MRLLHGIITCLILIASFFTAKGISCYDCKADGNTCNVGECHGASCIKMETANMDTGRTAVYKSCSTEYEDTQCKQTGIGSKLITRCSCGTNFCNGDKNLIAAGLQNHATKPSSITTTLFSFLLIVLLILLFM